MRLLPRLLLILLLTACGAPWASGAPMAVPPPSSGSEIRLWQDASIFQPVRATIDSARSRLWVEMYEFDRDDLAGGLLAARARGVDVRLIVDPSVVVSLHTAQRLAVAGLPARYYPLDDRRHQIDHVKLVLGDYSAVVGGMNWGRRSDRNHDYALETQSPSLLERLAAIHAQDWALAGGHPAPLAAGPPPSAQTTPGQEIRALLEAGLSGARQRVDAEIFVLTDPAVIAELAAARRRGVAVRVLLDPGQDVNRPAQRLLMTAGVEVRWYPVPKGAKLHAKVGLFDQTLLLGSANWSLSGLSVNHELDLETADPAAVTAFAARFETDWARSS